MVSFVLKFTSVFRWLWLWRFFLIITVCFSLKNKTALKQRWHFIEFNEFVFVTGGKKNPQQLKIYSGNKVIKARRWKTYGKEENRGEALNRNITWEGILFKMLYLRLQF